MKTGKVKFYNKDKGFGFIVKDEDGRDIFFHVTGTTENVNDNDKVEFDEEDGKKGKKAVNISVL